MPQRFAPEALYSSRPGWLESCLTLNRLGKWVADFSFAYWRGDDKFGGYADIGTDDARDRGAGGEAVSPAGGRAEAGRRFLQEIEVGQLAGDGNAFAPG